MQGDNLHEISNPDFWEKLEKKYFSMSYAENLTQSAKHQGNLCRMVKKHMK